MNKCIRMGITASNLSFGEVNRRFYGRKLRFTAPLTRRRKTKFPTVKPPIYLPKWQIWCSYPLNDKTNATYEATDTQTKKNCNRGTTLEWLVEKLPGA